MFMSLNGPAIGLRDTSLAGILDLAAANGFEGVDFNIKEAGQFARARSPAALKDLFAGRGLRPATWSLPTSGFQGDWIVDLEELSKQAELAAAIGAPRCIAWVPSWSDSRDFSENRAHHVERLRPVAEILASKGCVLGLEFVGPKTLQDGHRFAFIRTLHDMLALAREIRPGAVGLLVDSYHLHASGGSAKDLAGLSGADIVQVHINDAPAGVAHDALLDGVRRLPLETGVIDLPAFMRGLAASGYDGPVVTEPFNARLNALAARDPNAAAAEVAEGMRKLWALSGLSG